MILLINCIMNSVILVLTAYAAGITFQWKRLLFAALMGGIYVLIGILPEMAMLFTIPGKLLISVLLILLAFGCRSLKTTLILVGTFFIVSFILGGAVLGWINFIQKSPLDGFGHNLSWDNLALGSIIGLTLILLLVRQMLGKMYHRQTLYKVKIEYDGRITEIVGMLDTGNGLYSLLGHRPVVLVTCQASFSLLSSEAVEFLNKNSSNTWVSNIDQCQDTAWLSRVEIIPYQSVGSRNMLLGFRPDSITLITEYGPVHTTNVLLGIYDGLLAGGSGCQALLHPALITGSNITKEAGICALPGR
jgi:stage II sporulation protein GA (sporulation sigma-E factor processing peptidase)